MKMRQITAVALALGFAALFACDRRDDDRRTTRSGDYRDQTTDRTTPSGDVRGTTDARGDEEFVTTAANANQAEVELGGLASSKGSDPEVKKFGQMMVEDHSQANEKLKDLAAKKGWQWPAKTDDAAKKEAEKLAGLSGAEFDKKFASIMVQEHEKAVALFEKISKSAKDSDLKAFAEKTLPTLQHHLKMARDLSEKVGTPTAD